MATESKMNTSTPPGTEPRLTQHRISAAFPSMPDDQFRALVEDIKMRGLDKPIIIYDDEVLDGWHRYRACLQAGVQPRVTEFLGTIEEATAFVVSANVRRRHLDTGQLALFTVEYLLPRLEKEARAREHAGKKDPSAPGRQGSGGAGKAAVGAAKITGVSSRSVERAKFVQTHGTPEDVDAVRTGKARLKKVAAQVQARRTSPAVTTTRTSDPKTTIRTPSVAQTTAAPTSAITPPSSPIDEALVPAWRELAELLHSTGNYCATATTISGRAKHFMAVLEGFRRLYDWESRGSFLSRLDEHSRRTKKITKKSWNNPSTGS